MHDDIVDESAWRRSQPSVNAKYGNKVAVLLGDSFLHRVLDLARQVGLDAQSISGNQQLVEGELEQLRRSYDTTITKKNIGSGFSVRRLLYRGMLSLRCYL